MPRARSSREPSSSRSTLLVIAAAAALALVVACAAGTARAQPTTAPMNRATFETRGWAVDAVGGRGGRIVRVTTLDAAGAASLREALEAEGPRIVVFEVGGVIDFDGGALTIRHPHVTVAGQTAPSPGITIIRAETVVRTHDVVVQHLRFRPGDWGRPRQGGGDQDGLSTVGGAHDVIVDHCSFSWATDENLSAGGPRFQGADVAAWRRATSHEVTFSHNLIYEGLGDSVHEKGEHSKGSLIHDNATGVLLLGNIYASNRERNALFKGGVQAAMVNNLIYNPGAKAVHYNLIAHEWDGHPHVTGKVTLVANALRHGPDTAPGTPLFALGGHGDVELHLEGNLAVDAQGQPVAQTGRYTSGAARMLAAESPHLPPRLRWLSADRLEAELTLSAGARPWDRDPIDFKLLSDVAEDRGRIPDSEVESSGYPAGPRYAPTTRAFDPAQWNLADMSPRAGWGALFEKPFR